MHQIDLGGIMAFLKAILRKYHECIETQLNICGKAAWMLTACLQMMFKKYNTTQHTLSGKHACLLPLTYGTAMVFMQLLSKHKTSRHYRATDNRHPLLVLRFILDNLFCGEVDQFNRSRQGQPRVIDPSAELVAVANTFLAWYKLFRRITPPKNTDDIITLQGLSHRLIFFAWIISIIAIIQGIAVIVIIRILLLISLSRLFDMFRNVFPYKNGLCRLIMDTEKAHSIKLDVIDVANPLNCCCD